MIVEVHPSTSLIGSLYPEIAAHNANSQSWERIQWLGAHCSPSPAKADKITRFLQERLVGVSVATGFDSGSVKHPIKLCTHD